MEETAKDQPPLPSTGTGTAVKSKLRYPLRSATKKHLHTPPPVQFSDPSRRGKQAPTVSKSVSVLDLSGKDRSAKPPRRLSTPANSAASPSPRIAGSITPISETRSLRSTNGRGKPQTPISDAAQSAGRTRSNYLSSSSYWLSQIKLSESASKHSVSLGFFKLALEAGCQPLQKMRDELRSYARRHKLEDDGEAIKELFESYNISKNPDQLQVSETCSQVSKDGTQSSDDEIRSVSSAVGTRMLKPKSLNTDDAAQVSAVKSTTPKNNTTATRIKASLSRGTANSRSATEAGGHKVQKIAQKLTKQKANKEKDMIKNLGKKSTGEEGPVSHAPTNTVEENKENKDDPIAEEISVDGATCTKARNANLV